MTPVLESRELSDGWELAGSPPGAFAGPDGIDALAWQPATVPGTVASSIEGLNVDPDTRDWWFRVRFSSRACPANERMLLCLEGIATLSEVFLNGTPVLTSRSMFAASQVDVSVLVAEVNELLICCRALTPELAIKRRPRARWRTALADGNLRFFRTMLLGRAPGFAPGPAVVGPWRPVRLKRLAGFSLHEIELRTQVTSAGGGLIAVRLTCDAIGDGALPAVVTASVAGPTGNHELQLEINGDDQQIIASGELLIPAVARWWPHTHGEPVLYDVTVNADEARLHHSRVGFRSLEWPADWEDAGLSLRINGVDLFARGAIWTPLSMAAPHQPEAVVRKALEQVVAAGMNMLRIAGIGCYESDAFHDLCDELGVLVWQDFMLANLDYPAGESGWDAEFEAEARHELGRLGGRPSLTVLCGGSEVAQQVAMLGLDPKLACSPLYVETLPRLVQEAAVSVPYVPNSPWGGTLPFRPDRGVANYYGVGAYLRELGDARTASVKFAGECLAFSNVPDDVSLTQIDAPGGLVPHHPAWKAGVPRDAGAGWDFEDVRDHYLQRLYGEEAVMLRSTDLHRYLELSRAVTGEVMAEVFGEWRRSGSNCAGGLILWLRDLKPGAGWGVIDHTGTVKAAYHHLRRALSPLTVWVADEGLGGMIAHLANDTPERICASLRVALYRDSELRVEEASIGVELEPHSKREYDLEAVLGRFVDVSCAYRFGPPGHDAVVASLEREIDGNHELIANAFRFPTGRPARRDTAAVLGLSARLELTDDQHAALRLKSRRLVHGVRIQAPGWIPEDDAFTLEPGKQRLVRLAAGSTRTDGQASLTALNLVGRVPIELP